MNEIITGSLIISVLHALLPNHWLPVLAIGRQQKWSLGGVTKVTLVAGAAHAFSTVLIGVGLAFLGWQLSANLETFFTQASPVILVALGLWFMYRHHTHHHFHLPADAEKPIRKRNVAGTLAAAMFFSPCLEIEAYFLLAGSHGYAAVGLIAVLYIGITVLGMAIWVNLMYRGAAKFDWHKLEHNAGLITGGTLVATGLLSYFFH